MSNGTSSGCLCFSHSPPEGLANGCESTTSGTSGMNVPKFELMVQLTFRIIVAITEVEQEPITKVLVPLQTRILLL